MSRPRLLLATGKEAAKAEMVLDALQKACPPLAIHNTHLGVHPENAAAVLVVLLAEIMATLRPQDRPGAMSGLIADFIALSDVAGEAKAGSGLYVPDVKQ